MSKDAEWQAWVLRGDDKVIFMEATPEVVEVIFRVMKAPLHNVLGVLDECSRGEPFLLQNTLKTLMALRRGVFESGTHYDQTQALGSGSITATPSITATTNHSNPSNQSNNKRSASSGQYQYHGGGCYDNQNYSQSQNYPTTQTTVSETAVKVKNMAKFIISNDLAVSEASTVAAIALLSAANVDLTKVTTEQVTLTPEKLKKLVGLALLNTENILDELFPPPTATPTPPEDDVEILK